MSSSSLNPKGYILTNFVSHTRFYPLPHSFKYTTLAVFVELSALENGELDIPLLFGFNKRWRALCALRPNGYLFPTSSGSEMGIRKKLEVLLRREGYPEVINNGQYEIWMLTMPSYFGFEGINPLTVYTLYSTTKDHSRNLSLVVFEVHNTFGETHVYFMRPGVDEDNSSLKYIYDHQWNFPRAFHVSPFNDRRGWYTVSIKLPLIGESPKPMISIQLRDPSTNEGEGGLPGKTKLTATLRTTSALPFTPSSPFAIKNILLTLISFPLTLSLSMPRILYQAAILHYVKGRRSDGGGKSDLEVYMRPEPFLPPSSTLQSAWDENGIQLFPASGAGLTIRRLPYGFMASLAKKRVREFLHHRVQMLSEGRSVGVVLVEPTVYGDTEEWFLPHPDNLSTTEKVDTHCEKILRITPLAPVFFELLVTAPSAGLVLLAGSVIDSPEPTSYTRILNTNRSPNDVLFVVNNPELFLEIFSTSPSFSLLTQRLRLSAIPPTLVGLLSRSRLDPDAKVIPLQDLNDEAFNRLLHITDTHFLDHAPPSRSYFTFFSVVQHVLSNVTLLSLLSALLAVSALEPRIFALFRAQIKSGTETWGDKVWERVEERICRVGEKKDAR
ncbi:hypothetical protein BDP27DRAFT_1317064 [Rhodocollybia butyracea]|uniref:Uncharacterized protein n=1 Tax=Rhodocollybia butyracea TaxID=206335 RepID=A0A9P5Q3K1_9AGAR|nr:hypothetical protein BDP27DRAFT_1317064 [Rhodocollybia butyracea]